MPNREFFREVADIVAGDAERTVSRSQDGKALNVERVSDYGDTIRETIRDSNSKGTAVDLTINRTMFRHTED